MLNQPSYMLVRVAGAAVAVKGHEKRVGSTGGVVFCCSASYQQVFCPPCPLRQGRRSRVGGWLDGVHLGDMQTAWFGVLCGCGGRAKGRGNETPRRTLQFDAWKERVGEAAGPGVRALLGRTLGKSQGMAQCVLSFNVRAKPGYVGNRVGMNHLGRLITI